MRYDIAIIGTGPAGISAAITAKIRNKNIILLGSRGISEKVEKARKIENYTGMPNITGAELAAALKKHLDALDIDITEKKINAVYDMDGFFSLQAGEDFIECSSVIIACGVMHDKPLKGEEDFLGRGVSYCATCDGRLYKGKRIAVLGYSDESASEAQYLSEIADDVLYFPMQENILPEANGHLHIINENPKEIKGNERAEILVTDDGEHMIECVFVLKDIYSAATLVPGIETDGPHIKTDIRMRTNIPGIFACGDIAGKPYQYIKSAGQGNVAALSAVDFLKK